MAAAANIFGPSLPNEEACFYNQQLDFYQNGSPCSRFNRVKRYIKETEDRDIPLETVQRVAMGVVAGAGTGALVGGVIGVHACGAGALPGAVAGGVIGGVAGGVIAYGTMHSKVRQNYIAWKRLHRMDEFMAEFNKFHEDHEELQSFICPVTNAIIVDPVITKYGHTFSRAGILQWLNDGNTTDPMRDDDPNEMTIDDIQIDYYMIGRMKRAYIKILSDAEQLDGLAKETIAGLKAISRDLQAEFKDAFRQAKSKAGELWENDIIDMKQHNKLLQDVAEALGD